jgi:hypothetical protein
MLIRITDFNLNHVLCCCVSEWAALGPADLPRILQGQGGGQAQARLTVRLPLQSHSVSTIPYVRSISGQKELKRKKDL